MHLEGFPDVEMDELVKLIELRVADIENMLRSNPNIDANLQTEIISHCKGIVQALEGKQDGLLHVSSVLVLLRTLALTLFLFSDD